MRRRDPLAISVGEETCGKRNKEWGRFLTTTPATGAITASVPRCGYFESERAREKQDDPFVLGFNVSHFERKTFLDSLFSFKALSLTGRFLFLAGKSCCCTAS